MTIIGFVKIIQNVHAHPSAVTNSGYIPTSTVSFFHKYDMTPTFTSKFAFRDVAYKYNRLLFVLLATPLHLQQVCGLVLPPLHDRGVGVIVMAGTKRWVMFHTSQLIL